VAVEASRPASRRAPSYSRFIFRAPSNGASLIAVLILDLLLAFLAWWPSAPPAAFAADLLFVFVLPSVLGAVLTPPMARAFGGRFQFRRSILLAVTGTAATVPVLLVWRVLRTAAPSQIAPSVVPVLLLAQGLVLWFRHMSLFGVSRPSHLRSLPASLLQPGLAILGIFLVTSATVTLLVATVLFLVTGFLCSALLLRAADRPLRREFGISGVSLIRPLLDHINLRDPAATESLENFFRTFSKPANLRVSLLNFRGRAGPKATVALPTVHPGPFAALGGSDLPRKLTERLGTAAGTVFVPHTPCNHDLDLPTTAEVDRIAEATLGLMARLEGPITSPASPLVAPHPGAIARAQMLGRTALVIVTQAPGPTDDIDFAVVDQLTRDSQRAGGPNLVVIDAHNSYVEDEGDITYGTPAASRLADDVRAAVTAAAAAVTSDPIEVGCDRRTDFTIREHGIGPAGIRTLAIRAGGRTSAYSLIDGNNLLVGLRAEILAAVRPILEDAEVMTTDNHVVHEVDGSINPVGERFPAGELALAVAASVKAAVADLEPVELWTGTVEIPEVPVLGPGWTARLLTSLGDTVSMFANAFLMTFLLWLATSLVILAALR
jgi:putative membrane protein